MDRIKMKLRYKISAIVAVASVVGGSTATYALLNKPEYVLSSSDGVAIEALAYARDTNWRACIQ